MSKYWRGLYYAFFYPYRVHAFLKLWGMKMSEDEFGPEIMLGTRQSVSFYTRETWG